MNEIEIRCPVGPRRLFLIMKQQGERIRIAPGQNLMELACSDCTRAERKRGHNVARVLHLFDLSGTLIENRIVERTPDN